MVIIYDFFIIFFHVFLVLDILLFLSLGKMLRNVHFGVTVSDLFLYMRLGYFLPLKSRSAPHSIPHISWTGNEAWFSFFRLGVRLGLFFPWVPIEAWLCSLLSYVLLQNVIDLLFDTMSGRFYYQRLFVTNGVVPFSLTNSGLSKVFKCTRSAVPFPQWTC